MKEAIIHKKPLTITNLYINTIINNRAGNSVYLGNRVASQKKVYEPKTQEEGKKKKRREKKREEISTKRGVKYGKIWKRPNKV